MRLALSTLAAVAAPIAAAMIAQPASACVFLPVVCLGGGPECNPSPAQRRLERKQWSALETRRLLAEAKGRLKAGRVDEAADLAELLVPNVRPVHTRHTSCGPEGEIDYGAGRPGGEPQFRQLVAGTRIAHADPHDFAFILRDHDNFSFGPACNAEFRGAFAALLRRRLTPAELRRAWLFLSARQRSGDLYGSTYHRLVRFEGKTRAPPLRWVAQDEWLQEQVTGAIRRTAWGRSISAAADAFWREQASRLSDDRQICPKAAAAWEVARQALLAKIAERQDMLDQRRGVRR